MERSLSALMWLILDTKIQREQDRRNRWGGKPSSRLGHLGATLAACRVCVGVVWSTLGSLGPICFSGSMHFAAPGTSPHVPSLPSRPFTSRHWAHLGRLWGHLELILGASWCFLGPAWKHLEHIFEHLRAPWGLLGPSWNHLWASWGQLGSQLAL